MHAPKAHPENGLKTTSLSLRTQSGPRNENWHSVAVDTEVLWFLDVELPIEAAVRPMSGNGGVGNEGVLYEHASTDQSPRRKKSGR